MTYKAPFCTFLWLSRTVFSWLLEKVIFMTLCTKASLCVKSSLLEQSLPRTPSRPKTNQRQSAKSAFIIRVNPRLINDLRSTKDYVRKNKLFLQNKANFQKVKYDVTRVLTKDYDRMDTWSIRKNKAKTNPNKAKTNPKQTQLKPKKYQNKPNSNPIYPAVASGEAGTNPISKGQF